jgi:hypothetical protein
MRRFLSMVGGIALGVVLSQFPEYAQQYEQRLGGAVDELRIIAEDFRAAAGAAGLTEEQALARYAGVNDEFIADRGRSMGQVLARYTALSAALEQIRGASGWERFTLLPKFLDSDIGARALQNYRPAVPVTLEGFAYAGAGLLLGYLLTSGLVRFALLPFRRRPPRPPETFERQEPRGI